MAGPPDLHRLGVRRRLGVAHRVRPELSVALGAVFLNGTNIRVHQKAAESARENLEPDETIVRLLDTRVAALGPRPA